MASNIINEADDSDYTTSRHMIAVGVRGQMEEMASDRTLLLSGDVNDETVLRLRQSPPNGYSGILGNGVSETQSSGFNNGIDRLSRSLSTASLFRDDYDEDSSSQTGGISDKPKLPRTLGMFMGVFCPVAVSMFSTMLYLRAGFVVGQSGVLETLSQLVLAYFILVMTVLSICAISTNGALEGGGAYYMISRALGPEFGGSIGFLFYVANILACALYVTGFVEGIIQNFGVGGSMVADGTGLPVDGEWWKYLYATITLFLCLLICIVGGAMFARTSAIILLVVIVTTLSVMISMFIKTNIDVEIPQSNEIVWYNQSFVDTNITFTGLYTGLNLTTLKDNLFSNYTKDYTNDGAPMNYATVFAILFSSVTGILNGANMSGELKDPSKAIPKGTLAAVSFTFGTYVIISLLIGSSCTRYLLVNNYVFLQQVNIWPPFVVIGVFAATLSAALGNLIGASRVLEALGHDQLFWFILKPATISTKGGNPIVSVIISWGLVQCILLVGSLNAIAPITSVFFLLSYASTNLACLALELASAPNFRPTFMYFSWHTCLVGMIGCIIMCFLIDPMYSSIALALMLVLVILLHFRSLPTTWGSISQALIFHQVRKYLLMLDPRKSHVKYWRPQILLMVANPRQSCELMDFCNDIKKSGLYVIGHVKTGKLEDSPYDPVLEESPRWLQLVQHMKIKAFAEITLAQTVSEGFQHLVRLSGLGGMKVNTVCFGFYDESIPSDSLLKTRVQKRRFFSSVERGTEIDSFFDAPRSNNNKPMSGLEYIKLIHDSLKLQKNTFLCRNFQLLDKGSLFKQSTKAYIDVWPINFFRPQTSSYFDNTCLFMLQLACILSMQHGWKANTQLRVFLCVRNISENTAVKQQKLSTFLRQLRIQAEIVVVSWEHILHHLDPEAHLVEGDDKVEEANDSGNKMNEYAHVSDSYLEAVKNMVQGNSQRAAVTFTYLPRPPLDPVEQQRYLTQLTVTSDLHHPTVMVHGLHPVTSTTL